jgi:hypothetical protein
MSKLEFLEQTYREVKEQALNSERSIDALIAMHEALKALAIEQAEQLKALNNPKGE